MSREVTAALRAHVDVLTAAPRNRNADRVHLVAVRRYIAETLTSAGWSVTEQAFTTPAGLGVSDAGYHALAAVTTVTVRTAVAWQTGELTDLTDLTDLPDEPADPHDFTAPPQLVAGDDPSRPGP